MAGENFGKLAREAADGLGARNLINGGDADIFAGDLAKERLEGRGSDARREKAMVWTRTVFRRWLLKNGSIRALGDAEAKEFAEGKPWAKAALDAGRELHKIAFGQSERDAYGQAVDWLLGDGELSERGDWSRIGVEQALAGHEKWIERMAAEEERKKDIADSNEGCARIGKESEDGTFWVEVITEAALKREGARMRHCVGGYGEAVAKGKIKIYSKRAEGGAKSLLTVELSDAPQEEGAQGVPAEGYSIVEARKKKAASSGERVWRLEQMKRFANMRARQDELPGVVELCEEAQRATGKRVIPGGDAKCMGMVDAHPLCGVYELAYPGMPEGRRAAVLAAMEAGLKAPASKDSRANANYLKGVMELAKALESDRAMELASFWFKERAEVLQGSACLDLSSAAWQIWGRWYAPGLGLEKPGSREALDFLRGRIGRESDSLGAEEIRRIGLFLAKSEDGARALPELAKCKNWEQACYGAAHEKGQASAFRQILEEAGFAPLPGYGRGIWVGAPGEKALLEAMWKDLASKIGGSSQQEAEGLGEALSSFAYAAAGANEPGLCSEASRALSARGQSGALERAKKLMERRGVWIAPPGLDSLAVPMGRQLEFEDALLQAGEMAWAREGKALGQAKAFEAVGWLLDRRLLRAAGGLGRSGVFTELCAKESGGPGSGLLVRSGWDIWPSDEAWKICARLGRQTGAAMIPAPCFWQKGRLWGADSGSAAGAMAAVEKLYEKRDYLIWQDILEITSACAGVGLGAAALAILDKEAARMENEKATQFFAKEIRGMDLGADCVWVKDPGGKVSVRVLSVLRKSDAAAALAYGLSAAECAEAERMGRLSSAARLLGRIGGAVEFGQLLKQARDGEERMDLAKCALEESGAAWSGEFAEALAPEEIFRLYGYLQAVGKTGQALAVMEVLDNLAEPGSETGQLIAELKSAEELGREACDAIAGLKGGEFSSADLLGSPLWMRHAAAVCAMDGPASAMAAAAAGYARLVAKGGVLRPGGTVDLETAQKSAWLQAFAQAGADNAGLLGPLKSFAVGELSRKGSYASESVSPRGAFIEVGSEFFGGNGPPPGQDARSVAAPRKPM